jgi:hypothetical protein
MGLSSTSVKSEKRAGRSSRRRLPESWRLGLVVFYTTKGSALDAVRLPYKDWCIVARRAWPQGERTVSREAPRASA